MSREKPYKYIDTDKIPRWGEPTQSVAPFVPTPLNVVKKMLELAKAGPNDTLFDLGCGDGRILFTAIEKFNVKKAIGIDLNPTLVRKVELMIKEKEFEGRVEIHNKNFFNVDLTTATLVTLYLTTSGNSKLRPKFEEELTAGTRVISHDFPINGWDTSRKSPPQHYTTGSHKIFLYRLPEAYEDRVKKGEKSTWKRIRDRILRS